MCNRYHPTRAEILQRQWEFDFSRVEPWQPCLGPRGRGPFIRLKKDSAQPELVVGIWALIGDDYKKAINLGRMTNCARFEEITEKVTYAGPWARAQRCLIPAERFDYPNWESGKNTWWTLRRADGLPWYLAGIWNTWTDPGSGEVF